MRTRIQASQGRVYTDPGLVVNRSSSRGPLHALPAALRPPQSEERSDQIRGTGVTRGPRRPKVPVMGSQAHGGHPAAASRGLGVGP